MSNDGVMEKKEVKVSNYEWRMVESFNSVQGEGLTIGRPAVFIRFAGCTLACSWCDSRVAARRSLWEKRSVLFSPELIPVSKHTNRVVFTGGEPTLQPLMEVMNGMEHHWKRQFVWEVETNGTQMVSDKLLKRVHHWNVSPKLKGSQESEILEDVRTVNLSFWAQAAKRHPGVIFKFVVGSLEQMEEVNILVKDLGIPPTSVFLMREGLERKRFLDDPFNFEVIEFAKSRGFNYSPRLHILLWDRATGV